MIMHKAQTSKPLNGLRKKLILLLLMTSGAFAVDGAKVFEDNCKSCHLGTVTEGELKQHFKTGSIKAPPMVKIANRLKDSISINIPNDNAEEIHRFTVISFIKEYMKKPSWDYYMCDAPAINRFEVMPAQTQLTPEESQAVAEWIYDYFEGKVIR